MPEFSITLNVRENVSNWLRRSLPFFEQHGRRIAEDLRNYALTQASETVFGVYDAYTPVEYARTYQLMEGIGAEGAYLGRLNLTVALYDTARNRDPKRGEPGFGYPGVVEFGQGASGLGEDAVVERVKQAMGDSQRAAFLHFPGKYGWHTMPPRPFLTPAAWATANYLYFNRLGRLMEAWSRSEASPTVKRIQLRR